MPDACVGTALSLAPGMEALGGGVLEYRDQSGTVYTASVRLIAADAEMPPVPEEGFTAAAVPAPQPRFAWRRVAHGIQRRS